MSNMKKSEAVTKKEAKKKSWVKPVLSKRKLDFLEFPPEASAFTNQATYY